MKIGVIMEDKAKKNDQGKPSFTAIPALALLEVAKVFTYGKEKYGKFNYSGNMDATRYLDALYRHVIAYQTGEDLDPETRLSHLAHAASNALMLLDGIMTGNVNDDRNKVYTKWEKQEKTNYDLWVEKHQKLNNETLTMSYPPLMKEF